MGRSKMKIDFKELKKIQSDLNKLNDKQVQIFIESVAKELAAILLAKVIKRTPVGQYPKSTGKKGGTLRRGWTTQKPGSGSEGMNTSNARAYVNSLKVNHFGDTYVIEIINPIEYASYVEFGHRTPTGKGWVEGHFMLTISEQEIREQAPKILEKTINSMLKEVFT